MRLDFAFPLPLVTGWMPGLAAIRDQRPPWPTAHLGPGLRWYLVPILGSAALWTAALALDPLIRGTGTTLPTLSIDLLIGVAVSLVVVFLINSEEIAWRGFHCRPAIAH